MINFKKKSDDKACKVYSYQRIIERYIRKEGKPVEYQITAHVDDTKPIKHLLSLIRDGGCEIMKDVFDGKFIELDFSQNLAILPKLEVQSAHFFNKQYTLHCAIAKTFDKRYHCHLSHDRKHDGIFSDHVLRDLIINYNISNEALWAQKDKHLPNTRTNICLDFYSHWLTNLIQGSYTLWSCW